MNKYKTINVLTIALALGGVAYQLYSDASNTAATDLGLYICIGALLLSVVNRAVNKKKED